MSHCHPSADRPASGSTAVLQDRRIALVGSPNAGKTTLFNALTGLRAKVGNYPGVTVTRSVGFSDVGGTQIRLEDLPGAYSLEPLSPDEAVVTDVLAGRLVGDAGRPDGMRVVADATTLTRSLNLVAHALATDVPALVVVTMLDELRERGGFLDLDKLGTALGVPVLGVVAKRGEGVETLRTALADPGAFASPVIPPPDDDEEIAAWTASVLAAADYRSAAPDERTRRIDNVLMHPVWGLFIFFAVMFGFFQTIFTVAAPLQDAVESSLAGLGVWAAESVQPEILGRVLSEAVIGGVGAVLVFVPQIALLFLLISLLETVGYMSRAAFLMDRVMAATGLDGRAFVAMLSSFACAVPGIMATRTISSTRIRLATILSAPLVTCSARLPVYVLLIGMLVPSEARWGPVNQAGAIMFGLYLLGGVSAMVSAKVLRVSVLRGERVPFYLELPPYRLPSARAVVRDVWNSVEMFLRKAGTIIFAATIVLWVLLNVPGTGEDSVAAWLGRALEPVFAPLGFDWRINVAIVGSLAAREVFVATLGQISAAADPENPMETLLASGVFTPPTVAALLVFFVFALQCVSTLAIMRRETDSWRWPLIAFGYMFVIAWVGAFVAHTIVAAVVG